jgi:hypothetical protein
MEIIVPEEKTMLTKDGLIIFSATVTPLFPLLS